MTFEDWLPMAPEEGPPLPRFLGIYWPWYQPAELRFTVVDVSTMRPLPGAEARLDSLTGVTDANGFCSFRVRPGTYTLTLSKARYQAQRWSVILAAGVKTERYGLAPTAPPPGPTTWAVVSAQIS